MSRAFDPVRLEIAEHRFAGIAEEMGEALVRSAVSPNIKERRDLSCAVFSGAGELIAHAAHIPVHLGAMPESVAAAIRERPPAPGDVVIVNDPFRGGTHLPDVTLVAPVFLRDDTVGPSFFVANRAHHADVGGMTAGSMPVSETIYQEGIVIPPVRLVRGGTLQEDVLELILANVRDPDERAWDLRAQAAVLRRGAQRLVELATELGAVRVRQMGSELLEYSEAMMRATLDGLPDGACEAVDVLEPVGAEQPRIQVRITIRGDAARVDFSATSDVVAGPINAVRAVTLSAVSYAFRCLMPGAAPANTGMLRPIELVTRRGSLVDAGRPAAVSAGNVETSQRIVDVVFRALAGIDPARVPAASSGTMMNVAIGATIDGRAVTYYETVAGGAGATAERAGQSVVQTHMTNTMNTPTEAIGHEMPFRIVANRVRRGSGGAGRRSGGDGCERVIEARAPLDVSIVSDRRTSRPYGLAGGEDGASSEVDVLRRDGTIEPLLPRARVHLATGDRLRVRTPGGGGHGEPDV